MKNPCSHQVHFNTKAEFAKEAGPIIEISKMLGGLL